MHLNDLSFAEVLQNTRDLFRDRNRWTKGALGKKRDNGAEHQSDEDLKGSSCYCLAGGIYYWQGVVSAPAGVLEQDAGEEALEKSHIHILAQMIVDAGLSSSDYKKPDPEDCVSRPPGDGQRRMG